MFTRKINLITTSGIILLLSLMTACQTAASPALPASVASTVGNTAIQTEDSDEEAGNALPDPGPILQGDDDTPDPDDDDDGDDLDDDGSLLKNEQHPVANAIAQEFNITHEEIVALHQAGYGFGEIAKAYSLADELGMAPQDILSQVREVGWGKLLKDHGLHPSLTGKGNNLGAIMSKQKGNRPAHAGPPGGDGPPGLMKKGK